MESTKEAARVNNSSNQTGNQIQDKSLISETALLGLIENQSDNGSDLGLFDEFSTKINFNEVNDHSTQHISEEKEAIKVKTSSMSTDIAQLSFSSSSSANEINMFDFSTLKLIEPHDHTTGNQSKIFIPYRSDGKSEGVGSLYDHHTVQRLTLRDTAMDGDKEKLDKILFQLKQKTFALIRPIHINVNDFDLGLIFMPGRTKEKENDVERATRERLLIARARKQGQPILAVCGGSWRLWEEYGGSLNEVKHHNYNGGMVRLNDQGSITHNVQIHGVQIKRDSMLAEAIGCNQPKNDITLLVNSVHSKAPSRECMPNDFCISATSVSNHEISITTRSNEEMKSEIDSIEGFESKFGSPVIGVLWHPEAYNLDDNRKHSSSTLEWFSATAHINLLRKMAKAGDAFFLKKRVLREIRTKVKLINS